MPPIITPGSPSTDLPIMIDGRPLKFRPASIPMPSTPTTIRQQMIDGSACVWKQRPFYPGVPRQNAPFTITMDFDSVRDDLEALEEIYAGGDTHLLTIWRYSTICYTLEAGITRLYFPRTRRCAAHFYAGVTIEPLRGIVADVEKLPTLVTVDGDSLTVSYESGPTLSTPDAGEIIIAKYPDESGRAQGAVPMRLGDTPAGGEELVMKTFVTIECEMRCDVTLRPGMSESHAYTFVEI